MKLSRAGVRSITQNGKGGYATRPMSNPLRKPSSSKKKPNGVGQVHGRTLGDDIDFKRLDEARKHGNIETADSASGSGIPAGTSTTNISGKSNYNSILQEYFEPDIVNDGLSRSSDYTRGINQVYRDIYYHDAVAGSAIDLMSNMPFSNFTIGGTKDSKTLRPFEESVASMNITQLLPVISNEYLVHGMFCATTVFDTESGVYKGIVPQNPDMVSVTPVPLFGHSPLITLDTGNALKVLQNSTDPRAKEYLDLMKSGGKDVTSYNPAPEDVVYIPRRALARDYRGVSALRRMLMPWMIEKALYRGTVDQSIKRQRAITHMTVGDETWTATSEDMAALADMFMAADLDPVGAVFVTRPGVAVEELKDPGNLWKVSDLESFFTTAKLRALGVSESFLTGETTFSALEQVMTVFVEQLRAYREMITNELFYENIFKRISDHHNITTKRYGIETSDSGADPTQLDLFDTKGVVPKFEGAYSTGSEGASGLLIPRVQWHKRLRPEADQQYLDMLNTLSEKNIPIPVRIWAAAGGLDLDNMMNQQDDDIQLREKLKEWSSRAKEASGPPPGGDGGGGFEGSALLGIQPKGILNRGSESDMEELSSRNVDSAGKRHIRSAKYSKIAEEKENKKIAVAAAEMAKRVNALESKQELLDRERSDSGY